jgi:hypothetical protein
MTSARIGVHGFASHSVEFSPLGSSGADPIVPESMLTGRDAKNP